MLAHQEPRVQTSFLYFQQTKPEVIFTIHIRTIQHVPLLKTNYRSALSSDISTSGARAAVLLLLSHFAAAAERPQSAVGKSQTLTALPLSPLPAVPGANRPSPDGELMAPHTQQRGGPSQPRLPGAGPELPPRSAPRGSDGAAPAALGAARNRQGPAGAHSCGRNAVFEVFAGSAHNRGQAEKLSLHLKASSWSEKLSFKNTRAFKNTI